MKSAINALLAILILKIKHPDESLRKKDGSKNSSFLKGNPDIVNQ